MLNDWSPFIPTRPLSVVIELLAIDVPHLGCWAFKEAFLYVCPSVSCCSWWTWARLGHTSIEWLLMALWLAIAHCNHHVMLMLRWFRFYSLDYKDEVEAICDSMKDHEAIEQDTGLTCHCSFAPCEPTYYCYPENLLILQQDRFPPQWICLTYIATAHIAINTSLGNFRL